MNRDYDIDSILAEIRQKKASAASQPPANVQGDSASEGGYTERQTERPTVRPAVQEYEEEYEPPRRQQRREYDGDYAEPTPPQRREVEPRRQDRRGGYEELRPLRRPSFTRTTSEQYNPADAIFAVADKAEEPPQAQEYKQRAQEYEPRVQEYKQRVQEYKPQVQEYEPPVAKAPPPRKPQAPEERRRDGDDEFIMKYSGLAPLGSTGRKSATSDRESIRTNFGAAAEPPVKGRGQAQKAAPAPAEKPQTKPELKGGFRFNPGAEQKELYEQQNSEAFTRLDIPLSDGILSGESFDDTRDLPNGLERDAFLDYDATPAGLEDEFLENDELPAKMEMEEYTSPAEAQGVKADLDTLRGSLMLRFIVSLLCALGLLYMGLAQSLAVPMPEVISPDSAPAVYVLISLVLLVVTALVSHSTISNGLVGMFTLKANNDSLAAIAVIGSVIQGTALFLSPAALANGDINVYFSVVAIVLVFNIIGKLFTIGRITGNFRFISSNTQKYTVQNLAKRELAREFTWDMNIDEPHVGYSEKVGFIDNFIEQSYAEDSTENIAKITVPIIFIGSIVVAVMSYVFNGDLLVALSTFAAVLAIAAPITSTIVGSLPQHKAYRALSKCGAALTGYNAVEKFSETNVVLADACELFTSDEVLLHNIKTFEKNRIDEAILDASSVLCVCNGAVKNIFLRIIQGNTKMLRPVENLMYEDAMGISAWVGGKRILIGNSDLMKHHGIDTPSRDYEAKYRTEDRDILYLANSGELTAMFVISYVRNEAADMALGDLERKGISVVVKSVDPNLTAAKIAKIYDLPEEMLRILPAKLHSDFDSLSKERKSDKGYIVHSGTFAGFARAVSAASGVKIATNIGLIIQIVGMVLGYTLITFFSFMGSMAQATMTTILLYQLVWGAAVWLFSTLRRI